jgi:hypothetical protein
MTIIVTPHIIEADTIEIIDLEGEVRCIPAYELEDFLEDMNDELEYDRLSVYAS